MLILAPEPVPATLGPVQVDRGPINSWIGAESIAHVDVRLGAEVAQGHFDATILTEGLDERADRVERRGVHLVAKLFRLGRGKTLGEPTFVVGEVELWLSDEERVCAESVEWLKPAPTLIESTFEFIDGGGSWGDQAPAENGCSCHSLLESGRKWARASLVPLSGGTPFTPGDSAREPPGVNGGVLAPRSR